MIDEVLSGQRKWAIVQGDCREVLARIDGCVVTLAI